MIVMEDADLDKAAELAVAGATKNSGQRCTAVKRILVVEAVADDFAKLVTAKAKKLKCGDPMDPSTDVGTVITEDAAKLFQRRVVDATKVGAQLLHGDLERRTCPQRRLLENQRQILPCQRRRRLHPLHRRRGKKPGEAVGRQLRQRQ